MVLTGYWIWGRKIAQRLHTVEQTIWEVFRELVPLWLSSLFFLITWETLGFWSFALAWAKRFETQTSALFALLHLGLFLAAYYISFSITDSYHLSDQFWYARLALGGFLMSLYLLKSLYQNLKMEEFETYEFVKGFRILFFCLLPLLFLTTVKRHAIEWIEPALWISAWMAYGLYKGLRYQALRAEVLVLVCGAILLSIGQMSLLGILVGILSLGILAGLERSDQEEKLAQSAFKPLLWLTPYLISGLLTYAIYMTLWIEMATGNAIFSFGQNDSSLLALLIMNLILWGFLLTKDKQTGIRWNIELVFHQVQTFLAYTALLILLHVSIEGPVLSVLLVLHAIVLIFLSLKEKIKVLTKLSISLFVLALLKVIFHDIRDFATIEKIAVLIVLGVLLLGGAYTYVRLKRHWEGRQEILG